MMETKYGYEINLNDESTATKVIQLVGYNKNVLEFGCSSGYMTKVLHAKYNNDIIGVEIDKKAAEIAKQYCKRVIVGDAESIDFEDELQGEMFDVILFADVLEHLKDPALMIRKVRKLLKDSGYIVASIPNISYIAVILELIRGKFEYRSLGILDDTHLRFFTLDTICKMFEEEGYYIDIVERTKLDPFDSEFNTDIFRIKESMVNYIKKNNLEWNTYQYIVKLYKEVKIKSNLCDAQIKSKPSKKYERLMEFQKENDLMKSYICTLEKDIVETTEYARKLEKDIGLTTEYTRKLEKDIVETTEYARKLEKDIGLTTEYARKLERDITDITEYTSKLERDK